MRNLARFLLQRDAMLMGFLVVKAATSVIKGVAVNSNEVWGLGVLAVAAYAVIAWFAHQGRVVSIWAITLLMLYEGAGLLLMGVKLFPSSPLTAVLGLIVAAYVILGALIVFPSRHGGR